MKSDLARRTGANPLAHAIHVLGGDTAPASRREHFSRAHAERCCYLCHLPYASANPACACPHWFLMPWPDVARFDAIFATYGLAGVLDFLLVYMTGERKLRLPHRLIGACRHDDGSLQLQLKVRGRIWCFGLAAPALPARGTDGAILTVGMRTRTGRLLRCTAPATAADRTLLAALVQQVADRGALVGSAY